MTQREALAQISRRTDAEDLAVANLIIVRGLSDFLEKKQVTETVTDKIVNTQNSLLISKLLRSGNLLSEHGMKRVFHEGSAKLKKLLMSRKQPLTQELQEELLMHSDNELLAHYINHHHLSEKSELLMLRTKPVGVIEYYINQHPFSPSAQKELLRLPKILKTYVLRRGLGSDALKEYLRGNPDSDIMRLIVSKQLKADEEYLILKYAAPEFVVKYWEKYSFQPINDVISILIKREMFELAAQVITDGEEHLTVRLSEVLNAPTIVVEAYVKQFTLSDDVIRKIINRNISSEIMLVIKKNFLNQRELKEILQRGYSNEIIATLENQRIFDDIQMDILQRGELCEILTMCKTQVLSKSAQEWLIQNASDEVLTTYMDTRGLYSITSLLEKRPNLVGYYISRHILTNSQLKVFVEKANDQLIGAYLDLYYSEI